MAECNAIKFGRNSWWQLPRVTDLSYLCVMLREIWDDEFRGGHDVLQ